MPNHCDNVLTITGKRETLDRIIERHIKKQEFGENLEFDTIIPYPQRFRDQDEIARQHRTANPNDWSVKDGFNSGGYEWCVDNWGTKWSAYDGCYRFVAETELILNFQTAWSPPEPIILALAEMYPDADFTLEYSEYGMNFYGKLVCQDGKVVEAWCKEIPEGEGEDEEFEDEEWAEILET